MDVKKIKNKYKQLKYQHLKKIYNKNLMRLPQNCRYNKEIRLPNRSKLNICTFDFEDTYDIDLCYKSDDAKECSAFCVKKTKEELYRSFIEELGDDQIRATKYKDINTLYWLQSQLKFDEFPEKIKWFNKLVWFFKGLFSKA